MPAESFTLAAAQLAQLVTSHANESKHPLISNANASTAAQLGAKQESSLSLETATAANAAAAPPT